ncbi:MAG TPA: hypothetical protein VJ836_06450 [Candidatus Saccharimonadales bacterium]|nr:hypothetical protein [Candidatus Saccharimonadales bacterium]
MSVEVDRQHWATAEMLRYKERLAEGRGILMPESIGRVTLGLLVEHGRAPYITELPHRLQIAGFADRPWPTHSLYDRLVDIRYIPPLTMPNGFKLIPQDIWELKIIDNVRVNVDGRVHRLRGDQLAVLNIYLLTRDMTLLDNEAVRLGFAPRGTTFMRNSFAQARRELANKMGPHRLLRRAEGSDHFVHWQLHPGVYTRDSRD